MSNLQLIEELCKILDSAQQIIRDQARILNEHGIVTDDGELERQRTALLEKIEKTI